MDSEDGPGTKMILDLFLDMISSSWYWWSIGEAVMASTSGTEGEKGRRDETFIRTLSAIDHSVLGTRVTWFSCLSPSWEEIKGYWTDCGDGGLKGFIQFCLTPRVNIFKTFPFLPVYDTEATGMAVLCQKPSLLKKMLWESESWEGEMLSSVQLVLAPGRQTFISHNQKEGYSPPRTVSSLEGFLLSCK